MSDVFTASRTMTNTSPSIICSFFVVVLRIIIIINFNFCNLILYFLCFFEQKNSTFIHSCALFTRACPKRAVLLLYSQCRNATVILRYLLSKSVNVGRKLNVFGNYLENTFYASRFTPYVPLPLTDAL